MPIPCAIRITTILRFWAVRLSTLLRWDSTQCTIPASMGVEPTLVSHCHWDVAPIGLGFLAVLPKPFLLFSDEHLVDTPQLLCGLEMTFKAVLVLYLDTVNFSGRNGNANLHCSRSLLYYGGKIRQRLKQVL